VSKKSNDSDGTTKTQVLSRIKEKKRWEGVIYGEPASKANSRRVVKMGSLSRLIKSEKALNYSSMFKSQCGITDNLISGDVSVTMTIWYASRRPDLDESLILDLLQDRVYINDRQVKAKHIFWALDKENPRTHIVVESM